MLLKVICWAAVVISLSTLAWMGLDRGEEASLRLLEVQDSSTNAAAAVAVVSPQEPTKVSRPAVKDPRTTSKRKALGQVAQADPAMIELRVELRPSDLDYSKARRYLYGGDELALGPPQIFALGAAQEEQALVVGLMKLAGLEVLVTDQAGLPVTGAFVRLQAVDSRNAKRPRWSPLRATLDSPTWEATALEDGRLREQQLPPEVTIWLHLYSSREDHDAGEDPQLWRELAFSPGEQRTVQLRLPTRRDLQGRVVGPRGEPRPGVEVQLVRMVLESMGPMAMPANWPGALTTRSDAEGYFSFSGVPEGLCHVGVPLESRVGDRTSGPLAALSVPLLLNERTSTREVVIELLPALSITGVVVNAGGDPLPGQVVVARPEAGLGLLTTHTDDGGKFRFTGLPPCGFALGTSFDEVFTWEGRLVEAGDLEVTLQHAPCTLRVTLPEIPGLSQAGVEASLYSTSSLGAEHSTRSPRHTRGAPAR